MPSNSRQENEQRVEDLLKSGLISLWKKEAQGHTRDSGTYYPSYLGSCLRKQFYIYTIGERATPENLAVFMTGQGVHEIVASAFSESTTVESVEEKITLIFTDRIRLSGRVDIIIVDMDGKRYVIEVKSASRIPDAPYESHLLQLEIYLHSLNVNDGFVLYWNKRSGEVRAFSVSKDNGWLGKIYERTAMLDYHMSMAHPPPAEAYLDGRVWECRRCPYLQECNPGPLDY
ncbi:MAG: PD-(D/E)XK nuclease family protein [Nitrososphaerota archaeon]|nr:PD-(D/E)XK nuclease family protein [Nitrososphaerota archaeon]MDG6932221.1 PD-(D/E)XK nuclease family protein [Nitrososphaerota archaeon]MDG6935786.1 PD-(D/E)XK nuclease family protein [Nitrososphaerota archaeon]MDG6944104.1 PD-(D/E)XK nuclease family protein [Nitrososphaerota archaeon]